MLNMLNDHLNVGTYPSFQSVKIILQHIMQRLGCLQNVNDFKNIVKRKELNGLVAYIYIKCTAL